MWSYVSLHSDKAGSLHGWPIAGYISLSGFECPGVAVDLNVVRFNILLSSILLASAWNILLVRFISFGECVIGIVNDKFAVDGQLCREVLLLRLIFFEI